MIQLMDDCVTFVEVSKCEYDDLIAAKERMSVLKDYMKSEDYPSCNTIKTILGIEKGEK